MFKLPIIEYLNESRPQEPSLYPKDLAKRAKARMIAEIINSGVQPFQNLSLTKRLQQNGFTEEQKKTWLEFYLSKGLGAVEAILSETSGKYCVGDEVSIADLCLVPQVYSAKRVSVSLAAYPHVVRVYEELEKLPAFIKAHAHRQPDTPDDLREN
jgi:maleylacetoacetate isomerase